jgi:hypothetical protein
MGHLLKLEMTKFVHLPDALRIHLKQLKRPRLSIIELEFLLMMKLVPLLEMRNMQLTIMTRDHLMRLKDSENSFQLAEYENLVDSK